MSAVSRLIVIAVLGAAAPVRADEVAAKPHIDRATALHKDGAYAEALRELELAYALDSQPNLLYAIAQLHVKLGRCPEAITFYERFLETQPAAGPAGAARQAIDVCRTAPPPPEVSPAPPLPPPVPAPPSLQPPLEAPRASAGPTPLYKDPIGGVLVGAGVVAGVVGIVLYRGAMSDLDAAETAATYQDSESLVSDSRAKRRYAAIAGSGALVLIGAGVVHMFVRDRGSDERAVAITPSTSGAVVTWSGQF